jgi:hypothetical protein
MDTDRTTSAASTYVDAGHTYRLIVEPDGPHGWDVRIERDTQVMWSSHYTDWHRVERARSIFRSRSLRAGTTH